MAERASRHQRSLYQLCLESDRRPWCPALHWYGLTSLAASCSRDSSLSDSGLAVDLTCESGYPNFTNNMANCFAVVTHNSTFAAWSTMGTALGAFALVLRSFLTLTDASGRPEPIFDIDPSEADLFQSPNRVRRPHSSALRFDSALTDLAEPLAHLLQLHRGPQRPRHHSQLDRLGS